MFISGVECAWSTHMYSVCAESYSKNLSFRDVPRNAQKWDELEQTSQAVTSVVFAFSSTSIWNKTKQQQQQPQQKYSVEKVHTKNLR